MELFKTDYLKIEQREPNDYLLMHWTTPPSSHEFRTGMNQLIEAIKNTKCGKVLTDTRNLGAISPEDQAWSAGDWAQEAIKTGYRKLAILMPEDIFGMMSVEDVMNSVQEENIVKFSYFKDELEASAWLASN
jgi:hypothetical protein